MLASKGFNTEDRNSVASGGNNTYDYTYEGVEYKIHKFTANGTFTVNFSVPFDALVIGGGGGGSFGGGGAGRLLWATNQHFTSGTYEINIGEGGVGNEVTTLGGRTGGPSSIGPLADPTLLAIGGGAGGGSQNTGGDKNHTNTNIGDGSNGGSGGGGGHGTTASPVNNGAFGIATLGGSDASSGYNYVNWDISNNINNAVHYTTSTGTGITSYGNNGGAGPTSSQTGSSNYWGGSGGGAGGAATGTPSNNQTQTPGVGHSTFVNSSAAETTAFLLAAVAGTDSSNVATTGSSSGTLYIAGGGGGAYGSMDGGDGGGGDGSESAGSSNHASSGRSNTGGGGGGANGPGKRGGSGIVIIRYRLH